MSWAETVHRVDCGCPLCHFGREPVTLQHDRRWYTIEGGVRVHPLGRLVELSGLGSDGQQHSYVVVLDPRMPFRYVLDRMTRELDQLGIV